MEIEIEVVVTEGTPQQLVDRLDHAGSEIFDDAFTPYFDVEEWRDQPARFVIKKCTFAQNIFGHLCKVKITGVDKVLEDRKGSWEGFKTILQILDNGYSQAIKEHLPTGNRMQLLITAPFDRDISMLSSNPLTPNVAFPTYGAGVGPRWIEGEAEPILAGSLGYG